MMPSLPVVRPSENWYRLTPGVYAVSATMLQHVYSRVRGDWTVELENEYQKLREVAPTLFEYQENSTRRAALLRDVPAENWNTAWRRYEQLRFARLCHYLRIRHPEATIGYSIRVYRLDAAELAGAVGGTAEQWRDLIERTVSRGQQDVSHR
jgi:hypothetical protein